MAQPTTAQRIMADIHRHGVDRPPNARPGRPTVAEVVSMHYGNDGQQWYAHDDSPVSGSPDLGDVCVALGARVEWRDGYRTGSHHRYVFADGSAIRACDQYWDVGYADCWCWRDIGHDGTDCHQSDHNDPVNDRAVVAG